MSTFDPNYHAQVKGMIADLDKSEPQWFLDWADSTDLRDMCRNIQNGMRTEDAQNRIKARLANRFFNRVIMAGIAADVVVLKSDVLPFLVIHKDSEGTIIDLLPRPTLETAILWVRYDMFEVCDIEPSHVEEFDHDREDPMNMTGIVKQYVVGDGEAYEIYQPHTLTR